MDAPWYNCKENIQQSLKFIISRSQGPTMLKIGHFQELILENYAVVRFRTWQLEQLINLISCYSLYQPSCRTSPRFIQ